MGASVFPAFSQPIKSEFGFLEDIENAQNAVNSGKDFDQVLQKLGNELKSFGTVALWAIKEYLKWNKESISATLGEEITKLVDGLLGEQKSFGWLEDIENEVIKETLKSTVKGLIDSAENAVKNGKSLEDVVSKLAKEFKAFGKVALWAVQTYLKYNKESISAHLGDELSKLIDELLDEASA